MYTPEKPGVFSPMDRCVAAAAYQLDPSSRQFQRELRADHALTGKQARKAAKAAKRVVRNARNLLSPVSK